MWHFPPFRMIVIFLFIIWLKRARFLVLSLLFVPCTFFILFSFDDCAYRFVLGMERHSYSQSRFLPWLGNTDNGSWPLCAYLVASWHGIPSSRCSSFLEYTRKYSIVFGAFYSPILIIWHPNTCSFCSPIQLFWAGIANCNCETNKGIYQIKNGIRCSSCGTSWCNIWRDTGIWWWMCHMSGMLLFF